MPVNVNMDKARAIHMGRIRKVRDANLAALDVPFFKALESGNQAELSRVTKLKQVLRDIPQTFDLAGYVTPDDLADSWPSVLILEGDG